MAVYTRVATAEVDALLAAHGLPRASEVIGIAEGVENSNYRVRAGDVAFILTLYERRLSAADLPYFVALTDHLADHGLPVPRMHRALDGSAVATLAGRPACLIEHRPGRSIEPLTPESTHAAGAMLARLHRASGDFAERRANAVGVDAWPAMAATIADWSPFEADFRTDAAATIARVAADWPRDWPTRAVHTDLFPDNLLFDGSAIDGVIDFYFAADDLPAFDYMVTHAAWCWTEDGADIVPAHAAALWDGFRSAGGDLSDDEVAALPLLGEGAALRFALTRAQAWGETPADALVRRKDPLPFHRRMRGYRAATPAAILGVS